VRGVSRPDAVVALGFVVAAVADALLRYRADAGLLAFVTTGALCLAVLAVRRQRPVLVISVIAGAGVAGTTVTAVVWPDAQDGAGVWIFAMVLAAYSLGAHARGRAVVLGLVLPLAVGVAADLTTMSGWERVSGIVFVALFVGLLPTAVGRIVRLRGERLRSLHAQRERIELAQRAQQESAVLAERLGTTERLQPTLAQGLRTLAEQADGPGDPGSIEACARDLLSRTREEVVALTAPVEESPLPELPVIDHVRVLRAEAQPWSVIAAGAVTAGLFIESTNVLKLAGPWWLTLLACAAVGGPLALAWWQPLPAVALAWAAATVYARLFAPLDGVLSEVALVFATAFAVGALSRRRAAVVGLATCWCGQLLGVGAADPFGEAAALFVCWLGGLAVNEVVRLVEQTRQNNAVLERDEAASAGRAVIAERLRLAREIHDAIGHSLTVVALQAGAARRLANVDPERAREVMRTVAAAARAGVDALARDDVEADVVELVERTRETGLPIDAHLADIALLDPAQRTVVYRVIQEALTNVLRHAPGARASVAVRRQDDEVEVVVANSAGSAGPGPGTGRGLPGIRERVGAVGGRVTWRLRDGEGFEVRAVLPLNQVAETAR
jgi:signal transduction histidine kinase